MKITDKLLPNLLIGMVIGAVGQLTVTIAAAIVPSDYITPVAMLLFGAISVALLVSGTYFRIAELGGDGVAIPLCGLMFGSAVQRAQAQLGGAPAGKAIWTGFRNVITVLGIGFVINFVLGLLIKNPGAATVAAPGTGMQFIWAAVITGVICVISQVLSNLHVPFPAIANIMMVIFGGLMTVTGWIPNLLAVGAGGIDATAVGCGNGAYSAGALLAVAGTPVPLVICAMLNVVLVLAGALAGGPMMKKMPAPAGK